MIPYIWQVKPLEFFLNHFVLYEQSKPYLDDEQTGTYVAMVLPGIYY